MAYSSLTSKGQVTIPIDVRRRLGLKAGDRLWFTVEDNVIRADPRSYVERTAGILKGRRPGPPPTDRELKQAAADYVAREVYEEMSSS